MSAGIQVRYIIGISDLTPQDASGATRPTDICEHTISDQPVEGHCETLSMPLPNELQEK